MQNKVNQKGYIAFITALIISSFILTLMISFPLISTDGLRSFLAFKKGSDARLIADSCAEIALLKIQRDVTYDGEVIDLDEGSCTITIQESGESHRLFEISANVEGYTYTLEIEIEIYGRSVGIISWEAI